MSAWPGKYVIGLTGNIAAGKSAVRRMLEHLGAFGIDADALAHRTFSPGAPGYLPVLETFGEQILAPDGSVDRARLGQIAFGDPAALRKLEEIVHPLVRRGVHNLIARSTHAVIVIEAIKLLESPLRSACDSLWVAAAPYPLQIERLVQTRGMSQELARQRILAQPSQEEKIAAADVVIYNQGSPEALWQQAREAWQQHAPTDLLQARPGPVCVDGVYCLERTLPDKADEVAAWIHRTGSAPQTITPESLLMGYLARSYWSFSKHDQPMAMLDWKGDNQIARTTDLFFPKESFAEADFQALTALLDQLCLDYQCEVFLIPPASRLDGWQAAGYQTCLPELLPRVLWREAAREIQTVEGHLLYKQFPEQDILEVEQGYSGSM